jgi:hypothetical protein
LPSTVSMPGNRITTFRASAHALYCILTVFCITIDCMCSQHHLIPATPHRGTWDPS